MQDGYDSVGPAKHTLQANKRRGRPACVYRHITHPRKRGSRKSKHSPEPLRSSWTNDARGDTADATPQRYWSRVGANGRQGRELTVSRRSCVLVAELPPIRAVSNAAAKLSRRRQVIRNDVSHLKMDGVQHSSSHPVRGTHKIQDGPPCRRSVEDTASWQEMQRHDGEQFMG